MNKEDLKIGEIYGYYNGAILKWKGNEASCYLGWDSNINDLNQNTINNFSKTGGGFSINDIKLATPEEKHWLNECIRLNEFVTKEEAMETFNHSLYKLPEKWVLDVNEENLKLAQSFIHAHKNDYVGYRESWRVDVNDPYNKCYLHYPQIPDSNAHSSFEKHKDYIEITTEQFKKYVLKEGKLKQPSKDASIEEILEYCKKKYPIGTKFKPLKHNVYGNNIIIITKELTSFTGNIIYKKAVTDGNNGFIYSDVLGYAEIVEEVKQEPTRIVTEELITVQLTKEKYDLLMQLLEE